MRVIPLTVQPPRRRVPRRAQRYPVRWAVSEINCKPAKDAWMVDVSCMGARLDTSAALGPNTPIKFTVVLPDGETELWLTAGSSGCARFFQPGPFSPGHPVLRHQLGHRPVGQNGRKTKTKPYISKILPCICKTFHVRRL